MPAFVTNTILSKKNPTIFLFYNSLTPNKMKYKLNVSFFNNAVMRKPRSQLCLLDVPMAHYREKTRTCNKPQPSLLTPTLVMP